MATFEQCLFSLNDFCKLIDTFNGVASIEVLPLSQAEPEQGYGYYVGLNQPLEGVEKDMFPEEFDGTIPVKSHVISPGYRDRIKEFELE
jgi:hypothetical protein